MRTYLCTHYGAYKANGDSTGLDVLKETALYFDTQGIEQGGYEDGSMVGIDNIVICGDDVYYDEYGRSTMSSQIMRAMRRNESLWGDDYSKTPNDDETLDEIINDITYQSDEFDGQQSMSIADMNLCDPITMIGD